MLDRVLQHGEQEGDPRGCLTWSVPDALPVERLVVGRKVEDAAALLPRIFNLCRGAQEVAARLAFGLPVAEGLHEALHAEVLRDHVMMLAIRLPRHFGGTAAALPQGWQDDARLLRAPLFGSEHFFTPSGLPSLEREMAQGRGVFGLLRRVRYSFAPGEAVTDVLPVAEGARALEMAALENSVAGRWAAHPLMRAVENDHGRGPFWRVLGRVVELDQLIAGTRLGVRATPLGEAFASAARGLYAVGATTERGVVTSFRRVTPTDHLMAPGGVMDQALARLPDAKRGLAPLLLDILDPCVPVRLEGLDDA